MSHTNAQAAIARVRAQKLLNRLFIPAYYKPIMDSVTPPKDKAAFDAAVGPAGAGLTPEENAWLWNYLDHCDSSLWGDDEVRDETTTRPLPMHWANVGW
jgi:hypothetical protein